ncbi:MAG: hypothetical protein Q8M92_05960, partial [Candidatus Subteraquimicrobiales bacterium]|nr:hypothetical protein [Candidatus Subteraquimicrobiales bacterium]
KVISNLKAEGPWTWMSKAFQRTKDIAEDIKSKAPEKRIMIYLLTDCDNDPPPAVKKKEPPWKFVEVLTGYFKDFKIEDTNIYLLSYRPLKQEEKDIIKEQTDIVVKEPEVSEPIPKIPEPRHEPESGTDLWKWLLFVIALAGIIILIAWTMRRQKTKTLWIKTENGEVYEASLRGSQKLWLGKHPTGEYLELALPTYFLTLGKVASVMLCEEKSGEKRRVDITKDMQCDIDREKTVSVRFYEVSPVSETESMKEEEKKQHPPGPMDDI